MVLTLDQVLVKAIQREAESQRLYSELGERVTDRAAYDALRQLYQQEVGHQMVLEKYRRGELKGGELNPGQAVDFKIAEYLDQPEVRPDMALKDVFLLAAKREKASNEFYLGLAGIHPPGEVKRLIEDLAAQELAHKQRVEFIYTEVAFPQTDGG